MNYSISEQKKFLSENLIVERLTEFDGNKEDIKDFKQPTKGDRISRYLIEEAWEDDECGNTKVFLVRDKKTRQIAFYYALGCGILYSELNSLNLSPTEQPIVEKYIKALRLCHKHGLNPNEQAAADNAYAEVLGEFYEKINDADRATVLINLAEDKVNIQEEKEEAIAETGEKEHIKQVKETFPAIDIKFLCRNAQYHVPLKLDFKLGVYVFWEIIVPHILKISTMVGCKYVYLFAADNTRQSESEKTIVPMWTPDYDPDDEEEINKSKEVVKKLVSYYITELKFRPVAEYTILKPHFDRKCYTLIQAVESLEEKREMIWASHDETNEIDSF